MEPATKKRAKAVNAEPDDEALERGRLLFARECSFVAGAAEIARLPEPGLLEVAFAGRSNVGKSSLINALTGHNALARTSRTPGRTQQLNFFNLGDRLMLVDLPGYGYARASKGKILTWTQVMHAYLKGRPNLRRLCLLIDARHGVKDGDRALIGELDKAAVSYQAVLTKADKLRPAALDQILEQVADELSRHPAAHPEIIVTSARDGGGIAELRAVLAALAQLG
ncbi:MAG: ribosome biogenesis GTP-binding protein YihA/YsxC [Alphaproteobacteria bacterium]